MKGKDLINIGVFSAIYFVIVFIIAMLGMELIDRCHTHILHIENGRIESGCKGKGAI